MLISLILTAAFGRAFFTLAHDHYRHAWGYAILGGGVFIGSQLLIGVILGVVLALTGNLDILEETSGTILVNVGGLALSAIICWILYAMLKKSWTKNPRNQKEDNNLLDQ